MTPRVHKDPFLALFDGADSNASTDRRVTSTTPLQALFLMNNSFVHEQARKFAERLRAEKTDDAGRIRSAFVLLFGRPPSDEEKATALDYLGRVSAKLKASGVAAEQQTARAWESLARALFLSNEFVYVD
jgi:hypothetical protein